MWKITSAGTSPEALNVDVPDDFGIVGAAGDLLYLHGVDEVSGAEPWVSDGTNAGTRLLKDINPGPGHSRWTFVTEIAGKAMLSAFAGVRDRELWISDGTEDGTLLLKEISSNVANDASEHGLLGSIMFFTGNDSEHGRELWFTDATTDGTFLVKDINPGRGNSSPEAFAAVNGIMYFCASDGALGFELWRSDGTEAGTWMVKDINVGGADSFPGYITPFGTGFLLSARDGVSGGSLWFSDGTGAGTRMIKDLSDSQATTGTSISNMVPFDGQIFFSATDGALGRELWVTNGTNQGTVMFQDILEGTDGSIATPLGVTNGKLVLKASTSEMSQLLWSVEPGSTEATLLSDPVQGPNYISQSVEAFSQVIAFQGRDEAHGSELWKSDGTIEGTLRLTDITAGPDHSNPIILGMIDNAIIFGASSGGKSNLYSNLGAPGTTQLLFNNLPNNSVRHSSAVNGKILFTGPGDWLYQTDGTLEGTGRLNLANPLNDPKGMHFYQTVGELVYFGAVKTGFEIGNELWRSDGTGPGTFLVKDIFPGAESSRPHDFMGVGELVYFTAEDETHGEELWISDGTEHGTNLVADIFPGSVSSHARPLATYANYLVFSAGDGIHGREPWITDGTAAGTRILFDFYEGPKGSSPGPVVFLGGDMIIYVNHPSYGREIWKMDASVLPVFIEDGQSIVPAFRLFENYPNPFKDKTTIRFTISSPGQVELVIYNLLGERVRVFAPGFKSPGDHEVTFDASSLASGIYFYSMIAGGLTQTRKMVVLK